MGGLVRGRGGPLYKSSSIALRCASWASQIRAEFTHERRSPTHSFPHHSFGRMVARSASRIFLPESRPA